MASTIVFENPGVIDVRSISSFGVSVKEQEDAIGFFGTGLKYAIAVLLRTGHAVSVYAGRDHITFSLQQDDIRGKTFDFVAMACADGEPKPLGFTTELGKQWELWMAYRELACNCMDEKGSISRVQDRRAEAEEGVTKFLVTGPDFAAVYENRHHFILDDEPWLVCDGLEIRKRPGSDFYYRGVRVHSLNRESAFTYNAKDKLSLTEDRTLKYYTDAEGAVRKGVLRSENREFIKACVTAPSKSLEGEMDFHGWGIEPSPTFLQVVGECMADRMFKVNKTAAAVWRDATKQGYSPLEIQLTKVQYISFQRALDFCEKIGFKIRGAYPIVFVEELGEGGLGLALDDKIFISERVFHLGGTKQLASTLIEEYLHLRHGWRDMSRELQSFLFEKLCSLGEELVGEPL